MYTYTNLTNSYFIEILKTKIGSDIILYGIDSMSYFGKLMQITNSNIIVLNPASVSTSKFVKILNPSEILTSENVTSINLFTVVGFGYDITDDPFVIPENFMKTTKETFNRHENQSMYNDFSNFNSILTSHIGKNVTLCTNGGFLFEGELEFIYDEVVSLMAERILVPGGNENSLFSISKVTLNLNHVSSVSS